MRIHRRLNKNYNFRYKLLALKDKKNIDENLLLKVEKYISNCSKRIKDYKDNLYEELKKENGIRNLRESEIAEKNIISVFDSSLTRTIQIPEGSLSEELIIVQTYFFDVIEDIIIDGFMLRDEKYVCLTASAGQIRTKKTVFIKEKTLKKIHNTLTCGLTIDHINEKGGINVNKYLAYLALSNSATDEYNNIDIRKTIVVEDMETMVGGEVDLISDIDYTIERKNMEIPIPHTDGCGMILPKKSKKNFMVRLAWVKGLLVSFPFDKFIREKSKETGEYCGVVTDIYGVEHDILKEEIEVIFTKSQFKMYKYFKSWEQYIESFMKYDCKIGICNEEEDEFSRAKLNYQMLQTLTDMTDDELKELSKKTIEDIVRMSNDRNTMLKVLGVTKSNKNKNYIQQALEIYPELLNDAYSKEILKQVKKSLVREGRAGKLNLENSGVYTFIIPDLYAFCEWTFLKDKNPKGLLKDKEVYCRLFKNEPKLDCLRSPHLYREHAVRNNVIDKEKGRWFTTNGLYTSCHDLISRILQFDVDGDKSLVTANKTILEVAERNMEGIVPLYYNMRKSEPEIINNHSIYKGLKTAYTGGNIGMVSNNITKIWNSNNVDLDVIKLLCMENNFVIDFAKTLYKPERPKDKKSLITEYTKSKTPHFFIYAKDKEKNKVEPINNSIVNRLEKIIPNPRINFKAMDLGNFDHTMLMNNKKVELNEEIINKYKELDLKKHFMINRTHEEDINNITYMYDKIKDDLLQIDEDKKYVADVLIKYLYEQKKSNYKTTLWECFGDIIIENLKFNVDSNYIMCEMCGKRIEVSSNKKYCKDCAEAVKKEQDRLARKRYKEKRKEGES